MIQLLAFHTKIIFTLNHKVCNYLIIRLDSAYILRLRIHNHQDKFCTFKDLFNLVRLDNYNNFKYIYIYIYILTRKRTNKLNLSYTFSFKLLSWTANNTLPYKIQIYFYDDNITRTYSQKYKILNGVVGIHRKKI